MVGAVLRSPVSVNDVCAAAAPSPPNGGIAGNTLPVSVVVAFGPT